MKYLYQPNTKVVNTLVHIIPKKLDLHEDESVKCYQHPYSAKLKCLKVDR